MIRSASMPAAAPSTAAAWYPATTSSNGTPRDRVCLRVEEHLDMADAIGAGALEVGAGKVVEVALRSQHIHCRVVDGEEAGQRVEQVGRLDLFDGALPDVDAIALGELELERRFQRALEMDVQLSTWAAP